MIFEDTFKIQLPITVKQVDENKGTIWTFHTETEIQLTQKIEIQN